ncbi:MAG: endolytic transglycosylase MltG, partial [Rhodospirillales bacterium]|nr:endolytic transglycosylase MltG [Rhodospirillales bacterium]
AGVTDIARVLSERGLIESPLIFRFGVRVAGLQTGLRAGEYAIPPRTSARDIAGILSSGKTVVRRLTVAEGLTVKQVVDLLDITEGLQDRLEQTPQEGALLPETYHFSYGDSRRDMIRRMTVAMDETLAELWATRAPGLPYSNPREALVMASIIEKETAIPEERDRVAAVFVNRLRKGMRLQSDPTVVYGLNEGSGTLGRELTRADLRADSPFNTYRINGLPPSPISNPGRDSIAAALNPAESNEFYFVADGTGGHVFARTLAEHNRNVAAWRKIQRQSKADGNVSDR